MRILSYRQLAQANGVYRYKWQYTWRTLGEMITFSLGVQTDKLNLMQLWPLVRRFITCDCSQMWYTYCVVQVSNFMGNSTFLLLVLLSLICLGMGMRMMRGMYDIFFNRNLSIYLFISIYLFVETNWEKNTLEKQTPFFSVCSITSLTTNYIFSYFIVL